MQITAGDGTCIVYNTTHGDGPAVLLLAGFGGSHRIWCDLGHVERLSQTHRVITMDMRGDGESGKPLDLACYSVERHIDDIHAVMDVCGVDQFMVWGYSFGGTVGYHLAAQSKRVLRVLLAGTYFADVLAEPWVQAYRQHLSHLAQTQTEGRLDELTDTDRTFITDNDLDVLLIRLDGMRSWPTVQAEDLLCTACFYSGTRDANVVARLEEQRPKIEAAGHRVCVLDGLDHWGLVAETKVVAPLACSFFDIKSHE